MSGEYLQENKISVRMSDSDLKKLDKLCSFYGKRRSDVIRGTVISRYNALVKKGEVKDG
jgi:hypothetical protein